MRFRPIALAVLCTALAVWGCQPDDEFPEAPVSNQLGDKREKLTGNWRLSKIVQIDEEAKSKNWPIEVQQRTFEGVITTLLNNGTTESYDFNSMTFQFDGQGNFTHVTGQIPAGLLPVAIPASGTWNLNDNVFASQLNLSSGVTTIPLGIKSLAPDGASLIFTLQRTSAGEAAMSYELYFDRTSN